MRRWLRSFWREFRGPVWVLVIAVGAWVFFATTTYGCVDHEDGSYTLPPCMPGTIAVVPLKCFKRTVAELVCSGNESVSFACTDAGTWDQIP